MLLPEKRISRISAVVENTGFFPTNLTEQAKLMGKAKPVYASCTGPRGGRTGRPTRQNLGHLEGTWEYEASRKGRIAEDGNLAGEDHGSRKILSENCHPIGKGWNSRAHCRIQNWRRSGKRRDFMKTRAGLIRTMIAF